MHDRNQLAFGSVRWLANQQFVNMLFALETTCLLPSAMMFFLLRYPVRPIQLCLLHICARCCEATALRGSGRNVSPTRPRVSECWAEVKRRSKAAYANEMSSPLPNLAHDRFANTHTHTHTLQACQCSSLWFRWSFITPRDLPSRAGFCLTETQS